MICRWAIWWLSHVSWRSLQANRGNDSTAWSVVQRGEADCYGTCLSPFLPLCLGTLPPVIVVVLLVPVWDQPSTGRWTLSPLTFSRTHASDSLLSFLLYWVSPIVVRKILSLFPVLLQLPPVSLPTFIAQIFESSILTVSGSPILSWKCPGQLFMLPLYQWLLTWLIASLIPLCWPLGHYSLGFPSVLLAPKDFSESFGCFCFISPSLDSGTTQELDLTPVFFPCLPSLLW